jgi:hypothetical protein
MQQGVKLQLQKFHEFETKFEKHLGYESGSKVGTFDEQNRGGKYRATVPLQYLFYFSQSLVKNCSILNSFGTA